MKVLFAVSNDNVSNSIIKKFQQKYKEIITSKNVYYFNAIIKELQKDKSYDVVVIGEDLEPISNNNYDTIDKFIFEKLDNISDEAYKSTGEDIPIILICSDRRTKSDALLIKLFGIGIYNALLGNDRNIEEVCNLINKPRSKKEAKGYYRIDTEDVKYTPPEGEAEVSETEIQNILMHYKKIGSNEKKCVESFNRIAEQYNDTQLRIIIKFLPLNVKAILEAKSEKYYSLMTGGTVLTNGRYNKYEPKSLKSVKKQNDELLTKDLEKTKLTKPVIIPSTMNIERDISDQSFVQPVQPMQQIQQMQQMQPVQKEELYKKPELSKTMEVTQPIEPKINFQEPELVESKPKRRGRPRKVDVEETKVDEQVEKQIEPPVKRGRGRPKKVVAEQIQVQEKEIPQQEEVNLFDLVDNNDKAETEVNENHVNEDVNLFGMANDMVNDIPDVKANGMQNDVPNNVNPYELNNFYNPYVTEKNNLDESYTLNNNSINNQVETQKEEETEKINPYNSNPYNINPFGGEELVNLKSTNNVIRNSDFIAQNSKFIAFVGTSKNGTSFIVNNLAEFLAQRGIKTAILDLTKNKNSYYMFTNNDQELMQIAGNSIKNLSIGIPDGVQVNRNLTVFTSLPGEDFELEKIDQVLQTLDSSYSAVLMDCDFETNINYFIKATEMYLVQSMDALTIQPLTLFLSELKLKNVLDESKLRIIINKQLKLKLLSDKMIIGGMAKYNEPSMTLQRDLFDANTIKYCTIPFEEQTYARYLEAIALCQVSLSGYSPNFMNSLEELANMVYPLVSGGANNNYAQSKYSPDYNKAKKSFFGKRKQTQTQFSSGVNGTLDKMRKNY